MSHGGAREVLKNYLRYLTYSVQSERMRVGLCGAGWGVGGGMRVTYAWRWVSERGGKMPGEGGCVGSFDHAAVDGKVRGWPWWSPSPTFGKRPCR